MGLGADLQFAGRSSRPRIEQPPSQMSSERCVRTRLLCNTYSINITSKKLQQVTMKDNDNIAKLGYGFLVLSVVSYICMAFGIPLPRFFFPPTFYLFGVLCLPSPPFTFPDVGQECVEKMPIPVNGSQLMSLHVGCSLQHCRSLPCQWIAVDVIACWLLPPTLQKP